MEAQRIKVIACATVIEEMLPLMPPEIAHETLDFGMHISPNVLREALQKAIDTAGIEYDIVILGYGLCGQAVIGLRATDCTLVVPRVDDCIAIFLGSRDVYLKQFQAEPGTYYLTKGWIEVGGSPFHEYDRMVEKYGKERADRIIGLLLHNYKRLAFINTGQQGLGEYRELVKNLAERFNLRYEEIEGSTVLIQKLLFGPWDHEFVTVKPGGILAWADIF